MPSKPPELSWQVLIEGYLTNLWHILHSLGIGQGMCGSYLFCVDTSEGSTDWLPMPSLLEWHLYRFHWFQFGYIAVLLQRKSNEKIWCFHGNLQHQNRRILCPYQKYIALICAIRALFISFISYSWSPQHYHLDLTRRGVIQQHLTWFLPSFFCSFITIVSVFVSKSMSRLLSFP